MSCPVVRQKSPSSKSGSTPGQSQPLALCCLVTATTDRRGNSTRQCIVVDLGEKASKVLQTSCNPPLALLTNHSTIPSLSRVGEWKLHVGSLRESPKRAFNLKENNFLLCVSCCGQSHSTTESACRDWTLLLFTQEFVTKLCSSKLLFPLLPNLELECLQTALKSDEFCMRKQTVHQGAVQIQIAMQPASLHTPEDTKGLETDVRLCKEANLLRFCPSDPTAVIDISSSKGSPIYYLDGKHPPENPRFCLLGMVCPILQSENSSTALSTKANCTQGMKVLYGVTAYHIIHSAITDGAHSELVPCLSFLEEALKSEKSRNVAIQKLTSCLGRCKEDLDLTRIIELLMFLLKKMPPLVSKTRRPSTTGHNALKIQLHANLLTSVFSCFRGVDAALVSQTHLSGDHSHSLHTLIKALCEQILRLMEYSAEQETEDVIQAGFKLCEEVLYFAYPDGPALLLISSEALEVARKLRERYRQNAGIHRTYATMLEKFAQQIQQIKDESEQQAVRMQSQMATEQQQLLEKTEEQHTQLVAAQRVMDSKEQVITRLESRVQEERTAKECLETEQKHWREEQVILLQEKECFQQEKQQWVQQKEEWKEESKQQQQKFHNLEQQLQEKSRCLEERNEVLVQEASDKTAEMEQLRTNNSKLSEENDKQAKELCCVQRAQQEQKEEMQELQQKQLQQLEQMKKLQQELQEHQDQMQKLRQERQERIQNLQKENQCFSAGVHIQSDVLRQYPSHGQEKNNSPRSLRKHLSLPSPGSTPHSSPYMARRAARTSLASDEDSKDFWKRDISTLFESDVRLRDSVCKLFRKVEGALGEGTWEHFLQYLQKNLDLKMDAGTLDSLEIGGIMLAITKEWAKKEDVTVRKFCDISKEIGIPRVEDIMQEAFVKFKSQ